MHPDFMDIYSYQRATMLHPFAMGLVLLLGILILILPRKYAVIPMIVLACFIPTSQRIVIVSIDFNLLRILIIFAWLRIILTKEVQDIRLSMLDYIIILWALSALVFHTWQRSTVAALINRLGNAFDAFGMYFFFRSVIRDREDVSIVVRAFAIISLPVLFFFVIENRTGHNMFSVFGGVPEYTTIREGRLRTQGAFPHPIIAGCFWASILPLIIVESMQKRFPKNRISIVVAIISVVVIVLLSASSTPVMSLIFGIIAATFFIFRKHMRLVRWAIVVSFLALAIVMKAPVWHLIARVDISGGSTGWHRYNLINQAINRVDEWWLFGTSNINHWNVFANDVTNHYIAIAINGGLVTLALFIAIIVLGFKNVGRMRKACTTRECEIYTWGLGVMLFIHVTNFIAVSYFGQIILIWYLTLGIIGSLRKLGQ